MFKSKGTSSVTFIFGTPEISGGLLTGEIVKVISFVVNPMPSETVILISSDKILSGYNNKRL